MPTLPATFSFSGRAAALTATTALALLPASALAATIQGGPGNERLLGTQAPDAIDANAGNDRVFGLAGSDELAGGLGNDRVFGHRGEDTITGAQGNDWLNGGRGNDTITGDANDTGDRSSFDRIFGAAGDDTLRGGDARDRIFGGRGNDASFGERGRDLMGGGPGDDRQEGGEGNDRIYASRGRDTSFGGDGNDTLWAMARADVQPGPGGATDTAGDALDGGSGNDTFRTRDGEADQIACGPGIDNALLDVVDVIVDATPANPNGSCERVVRMAPRPGAAAPEDRQETPAGENEGS